ncbi:MAG: hypothetical protein SGILL_004095 [Bacillariaceae sp.]
MFAQLTFINRGSVSYVMKVDGNNTKNSNDHGYNYSETTSFIDGSIVLKGNLYQKAFDLRSWEKRQMEALVQDHTTGSPFVTNIYSQCANSFLSPLSPGGSLYDYIVSMKYHKQPVLSAVDKLKIAIHLAAGLAALHDLGDTAPNATTTSSYAHNDLDTNQYIYHDGFFKITDLNYGKLNTKRHPDSNVSACFQQPGMHPYLFRSPEDLTYAYARYVQQEEEMTDDKETDKVVTELVQGKDRPFDYSRSDVYNLGSAIHAMWSLHWMWNNDDIYSNLVGALKGQRPPLPVPTVTAKGTTLNDKPWKAHAAVAKAIELCWTHEPEKRPTAQYVSTFLKQELVAILGLSDDSQDIPLQHLRLDLAPPKKDGYKGKTAEQADPDFNKFQRL